VCFPLRNNKISHEIDKDLKGLNACLWWKVHLAYPASLQALHSNTIIQIQHNMIKNPIWQRATSWLFTITRVAEDFNSGRPREQIEHVTKVVLEPGTAGLRWPLLGHAASLDVYVAHIWTENSSNVELPASFLKLVPRTYSGQLQVPFLPTMFKALNSEIVRSRLARNPQSVQWHIPIWAKLAL